MNNTWVKVSVFVFLYSILMLLSQEFPSGSVKFIWSDLIWSDLIWSDRIWSDLIGSDRIWSDRIGSDCLLCLSVVTHSFQHFLSVVTVHHEQVDLPAGVAVHRVHLQREEELFTGSFCCSIDPQHQRQNQNQRQDWASVSHLLASWMVGQFVVRSVKRLTGVHRVQDHFVSHHHLQQEAHNSSLYSLFRGKKQTVTWRLSGEVLLASEPITEQGKVKYITRNFLIWRLNKMKIEVWSGNVRPLGGVIAPAWCWETDWTWWKIDQTDLWLSPTCSTAGRETCTNWESVRNMLRAELPGGVSLM